MGAPIVDEVAAAVDEVKTVVEEKILHIPVLVHSKVGHTLVHGSSRYGRFNQWLAVKITKAVGTMTMAYIFTIVALIGLPSALQQMRSQGPLPLVQWIAQTFLQLVLLSVIIVGQNVIQATNDARAEAEFDTVKEIHDINVNQTKILELLAAKK